jgi:hypothetical protein
MFLFVSNGGKQKMIEHRIDAPWQFGQLLSRFDGIQRSALTVSKVPEGRYYEDLSDDEKTAMSESYIQAAGSAQAMSVELRFLIDGVHRLFVIGRPGPRYGEPAVEIPFFGGKHSLTVYSEEVFTADDAAQLFFEWATNGDIDHTKHHLREFDLDAFYPT